MLRRYSFLILDNLLWLILSLIVATLLWVTAKLESDPFVTRTYQAVEIDYRIPDSLIVTNTLPSTAWVALRVQQSDAQRLSADDLSIVVDLSDVVLEGRLSIPLEVQVARQVTVLDLDPKQVNLDVEQRFERIIPLEMLVMEEPPRTVKLESLTANANQILVTGTEDEVNRVASARVELDLSQHKESVSFTLQPSLVASDELPLNNLTLKPNQVTVVAELSPRSDVRELRVSPKLTGALPDGYTLTADFSYEPQSIIVSGTQELLEGLPSTLSTEPIDLANHITDFEVVVPVQLPLSDILVLTQAQITVSIGIDPIQSSRQFDDVPINLIGLDATFIATPSLEAVTILVNGAQPILNALTKADFTVVLDLNSLSAVGSYQVEPLVSIGGGAIEQVEVSVLPALIDIQLDKLVTPTTEP
ncbi:MAG: YbbR-like domain-containing protein [Phototrophicaceae bacterium]